jgi:FkbM family methyltransferase
VKATRIYRGDVPDLVLPDHLADWDVWDYWERERYDSMAAHIPADGTLWVIGAEHGAMAALWSRLAARVVLVEPSPEFWPNIRMTWEANGLPTPAATVQAFAGPEYSGGFTWQSPWPSCAEGDTECPAQAYRYLHEPGHVAQIPTITLDGIATMVGRPDAVSVDIEGAEVLALAGASQLLASGNAEWWVSVHPDLIERDYSPHTDRDVYDLMAGHGYVAEHLATDHETHVRFHRP